MIVSTQGDDEHNEELNELLEKFEAAWIEGKAPSVEDYLAKAPAHLQAEMLRELLELDRHYRKLAGNQNAAKLGKYSVINKFPKTGQCDVFLAFDPDRHTEVIIKQIRANHSGKARDLFLQEARVLSKLKHPTLPAVYSVEMLDGRQSIVMEYIPGPNFEEWIRKNHASPAQLSRMLAGVGHALHLAHRSAILHRDVKPSNVLVDSKTGQCKLIDFGLAEDDVVPSAESGTPNFASPEQARAEAQTARSDVWGFGGLIFFGLTRRPLYNTPLELNGKYYRYKDEVKQGEFDRAPLDKPEIPRALKKICLRALAADPQKRFTSASEAAGALDRFARRGKVLTALMLIAVLLGVGIVVGGWQYYSYYAAMVDWPRSALHVNVTSGNQQGDLETVGRVDPGTQIDIEATIPAGLNATLFILPSDGSLEELAHVSASSASQPLEFHGSVTGSGTEFIFVCINRRKVPSADDLMSVSPLEAPLPAIGPQAVLRLTRSDGVSEVRPPVEDGSGGRGIQPSTGPDNSVETAMGRLSAIGQALTDRENGFQGIAFSH